MGSDRKSPWMQDVSSRGMGRKPFVLEHRAGRARGTGSGAAAKEKFPASCVSSQGFSGGSVMKNPPAVQESQEMGA